MYMYHSYVYIYICISRTWWWYNIIVYITMPLYIPSYSCFKNPSVISPWNLHCFQEVPSTVCTTPPWPLTGERPPVVTWLSQKLETSRDLWIFGLSVVGSLGLERCLDVWDGQISAVGILGMFKKRSFPNEMWSLRSFRIISRVPLKS